MGEKHRKRKVKYAFTLSDEEKEMLDEDAKALGLSRANYVRQLITTGNVIGQHPLFGKEESRKLLHEINGIGNNINQIAYNSNLRKYTLDCDWEQARKECLKILSAVGKMTNMEKEDFDKWLQQLSAQ